MWSELFALWSIVSYGITADPLPEDADGATFKWQTWRWALLLRIVVAALLLDLPLRHCQRLAGYVDRHSTVVPIPKS
jgi:hypothetical protein